MTNIAIKVENLTKRYRIGLKEEMPDTIVGALTSWLKAPFQNFRQLRRLTTFDDERRSPNGHPSSILHLQEPKATTSSTPSKMSPSRQGPELVEG